MPDEGTAAPKVEAKDEAVVVVGDDTTIEKPQAEGKPEDSTIEKPQAEGPPEDSTIDKPQAE